MHNLWVIFRDGCALEINLFIVMVLTCIIFAAIDQKYPTRELPLTIFASIIGGECIVLAVGFIFLTIVGGILLW